MSICLFCWLVETPFFLSILVKKMKMNLFEKKKFSFDKLRTFFASHETEMSSRGIRMTEISFRMRKRVNIWIGISARLPRKQWTNLYLISPRPHEWFCIIVKSSQAACDMYPRRSLSSTSRKMSLIAAALRNNLRNVFLYFPLMRGSLSHLYGRVWGS